MDLSVIDPIIVQDELPLQLQLLQPLLQQQLPLIQQQQQLQQQQQQQQQQLQQPQPLLPIVEQPVEVYQDLSRHFDEVGTRYSNKDIFIKNCNEQAEAQGFRLWIGEGRPVKDQLPGARMELACYRFRNKVNGKRTRVNGCRFVIKAIQLANVVDENGDHQWELIPGCFYTHNHPLGTLKAARKPNAARDPNSTPKAKEPKEPKAKKVKVQAPPPQPRQSSNQDVELEVDELQHLDDEVYSTGLSLSPYGNTNWSSLLPHYKAGDISVDSHTALNAAINAVNHAPHLTNAIASTSSSTSTSNTLGFALDPELELDLTSHNQSNSSGVTADLLLLQLQASLPPIPPASYMVHQPDTFGSISVADFLREQDPQLEQYADAFRNAGCTDLGSLLRLPEKDVRDFIDEDLPKLCPELVARPFHRRLLLTVISDYRAIKSIAESVAASSAAGVLEGLEEMNNVVNELGATEEQIAMMGLQHSLDQGNLAMGIELELGLSNKRTLEELEGLDLSGLTGMNDLGDLGDLGEYDQLDEDDHLHLHHHHLNLHHHHLQGELQELGEEEITGEEY